MVPVRPHDPFDRAFEVRKPRLSSRTRFGANLKAGPAPGARFAATCGPARPNAGDRGAVMEHHKQFAAGLENPLDFGDGLSNFRDVVQHSERIHDIEFAVREIE